MIHSTPFSPKLVRESTFQERYLLTWNQVLSVSVGLNSIMSNFSLFRGTDMPHFISQLAVLDRLQKKIYIHHSHLWMYVAEFPLKIFHCIRGPNPDKLYLINVGIRRMTFTICLKDNLIYYVTTPKTITACLL